MRVLLFALLASAASAQTPDPTPPARYYPLGVGDVWEYAFESFGVPPVLERVVVERDSLVAGVRFAVRVASFYGDGPGGAADVGQAATRPVRRRLGARRGAHRAGRRLLPHVPI